MRRTRDRVGQEIRDEDNESEILFLIPIRNLTNDCDLKSDEISFARKNN